MESRHWWIASKVQDTFSIGGTSNPSLLEEYICEPETLDLINELFVSGGIRRLFFYVKRAKGTPPEEIVELTQLRYTTSLLTCRDVKQYETPILYFIRPDVNADVDATRFERDILTGVVVGDPALCFAETMHYVFLPQLRMKKDWGKCPPEIATQTIANLEKYTQQMYETIATSGNPTLTSGQQLLKFPDVVTNLDFKHLRDAHLDLQLVTELESLVVDWSNSLENVLMEGAEDRSRDLKVDPSTEMDKWKRRQRMLGQTIEQLKQKECKNVITILNNAKSKTIKRWRALDNSVTECFNDARDKGKYLEALNRFFVQMNSATISPADMVDTVVPQLFQHVKNLESLSKHYARTGFLGLVIFQISNLMISKMLSFINEICVIDGEDLYVTLALKEVNQGLLNNQKAPGQSNKSHKSAQTEPQTPLYSRLFFCMALCDRFKEHVKKLKVNLNMAYASHTATHNETTAISAASTSRNALEPPSGTRTATNTDIPISASVADQSGISIHDDAHLMYHVDLFLDRTTKLIDVLKTMSEYEGLLKNAPGIPRPRLEDIMDRTDEIEIKRRVEIEQGRRAKQEWKARTSAMHAAELRSQQSLNPYESDQEAGEEDDDVTEESSRPHQQMTSSHAIETSANALESNSDRNPGEDSRESISHNTSTTTESRAMAYHTSELEISMALFGADEAFDIEESPRKNAIEARRVLRKIYSEWGTNVSLDGSIAPMGPSFDELLTKRYEELQNIFSSVAQINQVLDFKGKDRDKFEALYDSFLNQVGDMEVIVSSYILALFMRSMTTEEALKLLQKFEPIRKRVGVSVALAEAYGIVFGFYAIDMKEVRAAYERGKDKPPITRNAPPVGGAIQWIKQLIRRVELPMTSFRSNEAICKMKEFNSVCKQYNKLAQVLITFETLWYTQWKANVESVQGGVTMNVLAYNPHDGTIIVNSDSGIYEILQEAKYMFRMRMELPESALRILNNETRYKNYKSRLDSLISDFYDVRDMIPSQMGSLFKTHVHMMISIFSPGWLTITWHSMNIDAYLYKVHSAIHRFRKLARKVLKLMETRIDKALDNIKDMVLFDHELAFSRSWNPEDFSREMLASVQERYHQMFEHINEIQNTILEIVQLLLSTRVDTDRKKSHKGGSTVKKDPLDTDDDDVSETNSERAFDISVESDNGLKELFAHFSPRVYSAIRDAVVESLLLLSVGCGTAQNFKQPPFTPSRPASVPRSAGSSRHMPVNPSPARSTSKCSSVAREENTQTPISTVLSSSWDVGEVDLNLIRFEVDMMFSIPAYSINPGLEVVQGCIKELASSVLETGKTVKRWDDFDGNYFKDLTKECVVQDVLADINDVIIEIQLTLDKHLKHFKLYDFLWKDDMKGNFNEFMGSSPHTNQLQSEVQRMCDIQNAVINIPIQIQVGPICLNSTPIKSTLLGFAASWKSQYADVLHESAKAELKQAVGYQNTAMEQISDEVSGLGQLNEALGKLREVYDKVNHIDSIYLPIENKYSMLRSFGVHLPRDEVQNVESLRENWQLLVEKADVVQDSLMREKRNVFEQELDKQIMDFVVDVAQLRNSFEAQGPGVAHIEPTEAVTRLEHFRNKFKEFDEKRETLDSIQKIFSYDSDKYKTFPELERTGVELRLLDSLYELYQRFLAFDESFKNTLWSDVILDTSETQVTSFNSDFGQLPEELRDYDSYDNLKNAIEAYMKVLPLLKKLARREIRNRHWLQVMQVTGNSFLLEANVFKLASLLEIGLYQKKEDIEEICANAGLELELEMKLRMTEEEWGEQVLVMEHYKRRGKVFLNKQSSKKVLEQLEDAQDLLASMLTSKHIGPMREEAAMWAEKLKHVAEVLELWLDVQDLWMYLENVFSNPRAAKDLPQEVKRFSRVDKTWMKIMQKANETKNVIQCCTSASDVPKLVVLRHTKEELEVCFKSLTGYLDGKRKVFPRFCFVSDKTLFAMISQPHTLDAVRPHLRNIFASLSDLHIQGTGRPLEEQLAIEFEESQKKMQSSAHTMDGASTPVSSHSISVVDLASVQGGMNAGAPESQEVMQAMSAFSYDGELIALPEPVVLAEGTDIWLGKLEQQIGAGIHLGISAASSMAINTNNFEEVAVLFPTQVSVMALMNFFTVECETAICDLRHDRKGLPSVRQKYVSAIQKLVSLCLRGFWKSEGTGAVNSGSGMQNQENDVITRLQRKRFEAILMLSVYHKEMLDHLAGRKGLKELYDFEWKKTFRVYISKDADGRPVPQITVKVFNMEFSYGLEFFGAMPPVIIRPPTERVFVSTAQALKAPEGVLYTGAIGSGKTRTAMSFAQLLARYVTSLECNNATPPDVVLRNLQGIATAGQWLLLRNIENLSNSALSVFLQNYLLLQQMLKKLVSQGPAALFSPGSDSNVEWSSNSSSEADLSCYDGVKSSIYLTNGKKINVLPSMFVLATSVRMLDRLSPDIGHRFRCLAVTVPDCSVLLRTTASALGFRHPKLLADRLKIVCELLDDYLHGETIGSVSIPMLQKTLHLAKEKFVRLKQMFPEFARQGFSNQHLQQKRLRGLYGRDLQAAVAKQAREREAAIEAQKALQKLLGKKSFVQNLPNNSRLEHAVVGDVLLDILSLKLKEENQHFLRMIIRDIFGGLPDVPQVSIAPAALKEEIEIVCDSKNLHKFGPWIEKCVHMYTASLTNNGLVLLGATGSGKSSTLSVLIEALAKLETPGSSSAFTETLDQGAPSEVSATTTTTMGAVSHRLVRLNPRAIGSSTNMFGYYSGSEWVDGIFTQLLRKANRHSNKTWICLDSSIDSAWAERFVSLLENPRSFFCDNGDQLFINDNVKIVFETCHLDNASPTIVSKAAMTYFSKRCLDWSSICHTWLLKNVKVLKDRKFLDDLFKKLFPPMVELLMEVLTPRLPVCEVGVVNNCLQLLNTLMKNSEIGGHIHVERLLLFSLMWSFGGLLSKEERKPMNDQIRRLSNALPDFDTDNSVFDYFVDESGEWDHWSSRLPEAFQSGENMNPLQKLYVDTIPNLQARELVHYALLGNQHVLLYGPARSGRTTLINNLLDEHEATDPGVCVTRKVVQSSYSSVSHLNSFFNENICHRQGYVYGAPDGKRLQVFIDDINLPCTVNWEPPVNQMLRTLLDESVILKTDRPYEWRSIEDFTVVATMLTDSSIDTPRGNAFLTPHSIPFISDRLIRQFLPVYLPNPTEKELITIFNAVLQFEIQSSEGLSLDEEVQKAVVHASSHVVSQITQVLKNSSTQGRQHYVFSMNDIFRSYKMLVFSKDEMRQNSQLVTALWFHELRRTVQDQLCRQSDINWFNLLLKQTAEKYFAEYEITDASLNQLFTTMPTENSDSPLGGALSADGSLGDFNKSVKHDLQALNDFKKTRDYLHSQLKSHNEEFGAQKIDVKLSDFILKQIISCYRILTLPSKGNMIAVGSVGTNMSILLQLVCRVANLIQFKIDFTSESSFMDGLRSVVRMTGSEGRTLAVIISARDFTDELYMHTLNSLLISGDYPTLFSTDEIDGLYQALGPQIRRDFPNEPVDPEKFFVYNVMRNLHIFFTLPPTNSLVHRAAREFPGFLSSCEVFWVQDWPPEVLLDQAEYFIGQSKIRHHIPDQIENVNRCMVGIHSHVLNFCDQLKLIGDTSEKVVMTSVKQTRRQGEITYKSTQKEVDNLPYTKSILLELIESGSRDPKEVAAHEVYHGSKSFHTFLNAFSVIYMNKKKNLDERMGKMKRALQALSDVRSDVDTLKKSIEELESEFESCSKETEDLFNSLTDKSTTVELVKARCGITKGSLATMLEQADQQNESTLEEQDYELLRDDNDGTALEFMKLREKNVTERVNQLDEAVLDMYKHLEEIRANMQSKKDNVLNWRKKVDKESGCLDRIKNFQTPPVLVAIVIEMMMNLIGKKKLQEHKIDSKHFDFSSARRHTNGKLKLKELAEEGKVDRTVWKSMQNSLNDVKKFTDLIVGIEWENGLTDDQMAMLRSYIGKWSNTEPGVTGEGSLIEGPKSVGDITKFAQWNKRLESPVEEGLTIGAVRFSSEDAGFLLAFMVALMEYTEQCGPLKETLANIEARKHEKVAIMQQDQEMKELEEQEAADLKNRESVMPPEVQEEKSLSREDLPQLEKQLLEVQKDYDRSVHRKYTLSCKLKESKAEIASSRELIQNLSDLESKWAEEVEKHGSDQLLTNSILVSAFLTYCGGLNFDHRNMVCRRFAEIAKENKLPVPANKLFSSLVVKPAPQITLSPLNRTYPGAKGGKLSRRSSQILLQTGGDQLNMSASLSGTKMTSLIKEEGSRASSKAGSVHGSTAQLETVQASLSKMTTVPGSGDVRSNQGSARSSVYSLKDGEVELTPLTFLLDENELQMEENKGILMTRSTADNLAIALQQESSGDRWLLLSDPTGYAVDWIQTVINEPDNVVVVTHDELKMELFHALMNGSTLLVTDINTDRLLADESFRIVMHKRHFFLSSEESVKMKVANEEVEIDPGFRLFLHTSLEPQYIREELAAITTVLRIDQSRDDTMEAMLDRFLVLEKPRLAEERLSLQKEKLGHGKKSEKIENKLLKSLGKGSKVCGTISKTKDLQLLRKQYNETKENIRKTVRKLIDIFTTRESYREVAVRGAVLFEACYSMAVINPDYMVSRRHLLALFDHCIQQADKSSIRTVNEKLTATVYQCTIRSLQVKDRFLFSLVLALLMEESVGRLSAGDREYIIHPTFGQSVMQAMRAAFPSSENRPANVSSKKPFDWMSDEACSQLVILATYFPWFTDAYERMPRDGRETQWRTLCENEAPEKAPMPDKLDDLFTPTQRFMVVRGVRGDRVLQAAEQFIQQVLTKKVTDLSTVDYTQVQRHTDCRIPVVLLYTKEADVPQFYVDDAAKKLGTKLTIRTLNLGTEEESQSVKEAIEQAVVDGDWIFVGTAHRNNIFLTSINSFLDGLQKIHSQFQLWISVNWHAPTPRLFRRNAMKIVCDPPQSLRDHMLSLPLYLTNEIVRVGGRGDYPAVLHNIAIIHGLVNLRAQYGQSGWCHPSLMGCTVSQLQRALSLINIMFKEAMLLAADGGPSDLKTISWLNVRTILADNVYGGHITSPEDRERLHAICEQWIGPLLLRKDHEHSLGKIKYKIPPPFFSSNPKLGTMTSSLESFLQGLLFEGPELANLNGTLDMYKGEEQYILTNVNKIMDFTPENASLFHILDSKPPPINQSSSVLPVNVPCNQAHILDSGVFASASRNAIRSKKAVELYELAHSLLSKLPKAPPKDSVQDLTSRRGGYTAYNSFLLKEMNFLFKIVETIREQLKAIKNAVEDPTKVLGDSLDDRVKSVAKDLHFGKIPREWIKMAAAWERGPPSGQWSLSQWVNDLNTRWLQLDRMLQQGREKCAAYWLGGFYNPRGLLACLKQELLKNYSEAAGQVEQLMFRTEITGRDKDHLRDPPPEGMFMHSIYMWGCRWEKSNMELVDEPASPKGYCPLPVVHLVPTPRPDKPFPDDIYRCPVFVSQHQQGDPLFYINIKKEKVPASRWALRGLRCTIKPY